MLKVMSILNMLCTGGNMDQMQGRAEAGAKRGYLTASIDCRYHGRRCPPGEDKRDCYENALVRSALAFTP